MPKKYTVTDIMNKEPCPDYTEEVVTELWKDKKSLTFKEVCNLDIAIDDRVWISARLVPIEIAVKWADYCADEAQKHASYAADVVAADVAAYYAAYYAASAASATSAYAASAYAYAAANAAAANVAYHADRKTTRNKELKRLLDKLVEMNDK